MRLIHTADWHLGQSFYSNDRGFEHQRFLEWLLETLVAEQADVLLVAGDVFDNANPAADSQRQLYDFLAKAKERLPRLGIVLTAGNHDSPGRLEAPLPLLAAMDVAVVGHVRRLEGGAIDLDRLVVPLRDGSGTVRAWCLAVPFLRPGDVPRIETAGDAYAAGVTELYKQALELALARRENGQAIIALGHCHVVGGKISEESERPIVIGGAEALAVGIFDSRIAYVALGHLHCPQKVCAEPPVVYCGSPLPMAFSEIGYKHRVVRIDLEGDRAVVTDLPIPRVVQLLRVPERPAPLAQVLEMLRKLDLPEVAERERPYLLVRVLLEAPEPSLRAEVEKALEGKPVRLARIEITTPQRAAAEAEAGPGSLDDLQKLRPEDVFRRLLAETWPGEPASELLAAFRELLWEPAP